MERDASGEAKLEQAESYSTNGPVKSSLSPSERNKATEIWQACRSHDLDALIHLATSESGLVEDEVRQTAWPILLGYSRENEKLSPSSSLNDEWRSLPHHKDENQVALDVDRSFIYYPKNESDQQLDRRKVQLSDLIVQVLRLHPQLNYFQGFHDIAQVFLLVLNDSNAAQAVSHVSLLRIRDFMLPSLTPSIAHLELLPAILFSVDPKLQRHLSTTKPFFALASTLTLYAHDIQDYSDIARLFDFLLAQPAVVSVYFFAVIILTRKDELFEVPPEEPEMLHFLLSKLPKPLNLEALIARTMLIFSKHPPERLPWRSWTRISRYSVLKTTRGPLDRQSVSQGEELFAQQVAQLDREKLRERRLAQIWRYRRPLGGISVAVSVIIISYWLRRTGLDNSLGLGRLWELLTSFRI